MASLNGQTIASSYEQLLHTDTDGGGNGNTLVTIKDGDNGTTFGLKLATNKVEVLPGSDDANAFEVSQADGTAVFTVNTSSPAVSITGNTTMTTADNTVTLTLTSTDADDNVGPKLHLYRNSDSPAANDFLGEVEFVGRNDNSQDVAYASINGFINDTADGQEDGRIDIRSMLAGTEVSRIKVDINEVVLNDDSKDVNFRVESDASTHLLFVDAGTNRIGVNESSPAAKFDIDGDILIRNANALLLNHTSGTSDTYINSPSDNVMGFRTGGTQRFALNNNSVISLSNNDSGSSNTLLGDSCADSLDAGSNFNVFIGKSVATGSLDDASDNVAIGFESMKAIVQGDDNVAVGMRTMLDLEDGSNNTAIGDSVLRAVVDASDNTAVGAYAMDATSTGNNNVAMGKNALGNTADVDRCVAIGSAAMSQSNITSAADGTVGVGYFALGNLTTGGNNVAVGNSAMIGHTTGHRNIAIGRDAMGDTDAGTDSASSSDNVFIGMQAGGGAWANTTCEYNIGIGSYALDAQLNDADANIAMGYNALTALTQGDANVAIGHQVGTSVSTGSSNILIGYQAGTDTVALSTGSNNVCIGVNTRTSANSNNNSIAIGHDIDSAANQVSIGKSGNKIYNEFDTDAAWTQSSDVRLKKDIQDSTLGLDFVNDLRPVTYQWKSSNELPKDFAHYNEENNKTTDVTMTGLIAQEVKEAIDKSGVERFSGWAEDRDGVQQVSKEMFVFPLIKAVQELTAKVEELETKLNNKES